MAATISQNAPEALLRILTAASISDQRTLADCISSASRREAARKRGGSGIPRGSGPAGLTPHSHSHSRTVSPDDLHRCESKTLPEDISAHATA